MDKVEQARQLFARLEGRRIDSPDVALRRFELADRISRIRR